MKFDIYINESIKSLNRTKQVIEKTIVPIGKWLERNKFDVTTDQFIKTLNKAFNKHDIYFWSEGRSKYNLNTYIKDMNLVRGDDGFHIEVNVVDDVDKYLKTLNKSNFYSAKTNQFLMNLIEGLVHEFNHLEQDLKSKGKSFDTASGVGDEMSTSDYYMDKSEIDSHALQAAVYFLRYGKESYMHKQYTTGDFGDKEKTYKRFMKRYTKYLNRLKKSEVFKALIL